MVLDDLVHKRRLDEPDLSQYSGYFVAYLFALLCQIFYQIILTVGFSLRTFVDY